MVRMIARVSGRVQGVGYRYFTREQACALGLCGYVRNEPDGGVRVVAEGDRETLECLLAILGKGPRAAVVARIDTTWEEARDEFIDFRVRF
ncbi:acylphosphatase [bacterium]|nr:acylphosphatase [candidate division CSSED10-310 bacterium]